MSDISVIERPGQKRVLQIQTDDSILLLNEDHIVYCGRVDKGMVFHMQGGEDIRANLDFQHMIDLSGSHKLIRVHHSYFINAAHIFCYHKGSSGYAEMKDKSKVPVDDAFSGKLIGFLYRNS